MKNFLIRLAFLFLLFFAGSSSYAQQLFFKDVKEATIQSVVQKRAIVPEKYRTVVLDTSSILTFFKTIHAKKNISDYKDTSVVTIPLPDGTSGRFHIWESSIMEPALAAKYPNIKTYTGQGIDDRTATIKIDWTELGFHAMILSPVKGTVFIDPYSQGGKTNYISYFKSDFKSTEKFVEPDLQGLNKNNIQNRPAGITSAPTCIGTQLHTYRLAIACTHQYAIAATGLSNPTDTEALAAIVTSIERVDGIYERELSISLVLIANENKIIFTNINNDPLGPYNFSSPPTPLILHGQAIIDDSIGDANYDVGETFSTGAGGASGIGVVCQSGYKANSAVGIAHPVGDPFNVDYVSHEIGHEFGAHHPFNSNTSSCAAGGQQYSGTNDEPGSGSTVMAYASNVVNDGEILCGSDNLQANNDPYFNGVNFDEIITDINSISCGTTTATGNHPPVVNAGADYTIPLQTPFILTGSATDPDGDSLTYCWEQVDVGGEFCAWNAPVDASYGNAPLFRSFLPVTIPVRYFPKLSDVINNTTTIGEIMPKYARTMHFRLTARDNHAGGGGVCNDENAITVDGSSGPFVVTYPDTSNIAWNVGDVQTITWNPAGTQSAPVNCNNVMIQLSLDGGLTYPDTLLASTPNTGSAQITVSAAITSSARIRILSVGNIFYDISNNNFTIQYPAKPFVWANFSVTAQANNTALLSWTVDESNTYYYEIQRSPDGINFTTISQISSLSGNDSNRTYTYTDNTPLSGINYYRIKEVNTSGIYTYSSIISALFNFDWISFGVIAQPDNAALLNWTVNEIRTDHYEIERSVDSINFTKIAQDSSLTGNGINQTYSYTDHQPFLGENYYRIKEVDQSGSYTYSPTQSLQFNQVSSAWKIYPIPANNYIYILSNKNGNNTVLQLYDMTGRPVYEEKLGQISTAQLITIPVGKFSRGVYSLKISSSNGLLQQKILIE